MAEYAEVVLVEHIAHGVVRANATTADIDACVFNWDSAEACVLARSWVLMDAHRRRIARVRLAGTGGSLKSRAGWVLETASCLMQAGGRSTVPSVSASDGERRAHGLLVELAGESISYVSQSAQLRVVAIDWVELRARVVAGDEKSVCRIVTSISDAICILDKHPDLLVGVLEPVESFARGEWDGELATLGLDWSAVGAAVGAGLGGR